MLIEQRATRANGARGPSAAKHLVERARELGVIAANSPFATRGRGAEEARL